MPRGGLVVIAARRCRPRRFAGCRACRPVAGCAVLHRRWRTACSPDLRARSTGGRCLGTWRCSSASRCSSALKTAAAQATSSSTRRPRLISRVPEFHLRRARVRLWPAGEPGGVAEIMTNVLGPRTAITQIFAFMALPTIIFISSFFTVLYYFGVLQFVVRLMARAMMRGSCARAAPRRCRPRPTSSWVRPRRRSSSSRSCRA